MKRELRNVFFSSARFCSSSVSVALSVVVSIFIASAAYAGKPEQSDFPIGPDQTLTPGELCDRPETHRYPEQIAYCGRHVDSVTKNDIIAQYDRERGFRIGSMQRSQFKIDHYIPLCMGGSNNRDNLWPQHVTVYTITDSIEALSCDRMAKGVLSQADAVVLIKKVKNDLSKADEVTRQLNAL